MKIRLNKTITSFFGAFLIRILAMTWRVEWQNPGYLDEARRISSNLIFSFWHGRLLVLSWTHRNRSVQALTSDHYDGDLLGRIIERLGFGQLKGSTSKGGARAIRSLKAVLSKGQDIALAVDGPRGPRGKMQQGAIELSRLTSCAIVPVTNTAVCRKLLSSWDRFQLPAPFTKVIVRYGKPFIVSRDESAPERETKRRELEEYLGQLTTELDIEAGHKGVEVWPHEDN
ncbi:MAG: lysophospholipid acyltransferase family protein [Bacteroidales bacterium]|nr:lysophospholipid acyltransferase family protein [Candidatus Latescibacterota bacterium]